MHMTSRLRKQMRPSELKKWRNTSFTSSHYHDKEMYECDDKEMYECQGVLKIIARGKVLQKQTAKAASRDSSCINTTPVLLANVGIFTLLFMSFLSYRMLMVNRVIAPPSKSGSTWLRRKITPHVNVVNHRCVNWLI